MSGFGLKKNEIMSYNIEKRTFQAFDNTGTDTYQMKCHEQLVYIDPTLGAGTVYLPPVGECAGNIYTIINGAAANSAIKPFEYNGVPDSLMYDWDGDETSLTLASVAAWLILFCTGDRWLVMGFDLSV